MTRRAKFWLAVAAIYLFINVGGLGYAIARWEVWHAAVHGGLLVLGAFVIGRVAARRMERYDLQ